MRKPALLRAAITQHLPEYAREPDRLAMWVDRGQTRATGTKSRGFAWEYQLTIFAENYTQDPALLFFIIVEWLRIQQPDMLASTSPGFPFEVVVIDDKTVDVEITLSLVERVAARQADGGWQLEVLPEPDTMFPDAEPLRPLEGPIVTIWAHDIAGSVQVAP